MWCLCWVFCVVGIELVLYQDYVQLMIEFLVCIFQYVGVFEVEGVVDVDGVCVFCVVDYGEYLVCVSGFVVCDQFCQQQLVDFLVLGCGCQVD